MAPEVEGTADINARGGIRQQGQTAEYGDLARPGSPREEPCLRDL
jgi:hypothetical protein